MVGCPKDTRDPKSSRNVSRKRKEHDPQSSKSGQTFVKSVIEEPNPEDGVSLNLKSGHTPSQNLKPK